jgi:diadenosine tetraphosphate (Ap4A) HIT family hydrolase
VSDPRPVTECLACALADGRQPLPGGRIYRTPHWLVEHCIGPLGLGTLVLKPERHVIGVDALTGDEAAALGPLLQRSSAVARQLVKAEQVYNCLWSHAGGVPVHIHYVVQPVTRDQMDQFGLYGPALQEAMFAAAEFPDPDAVARVADQARQIFSA